MANNNQNLFTRCPHCQTMFRLGKAVSVEHGPWVKCGRCHKAFDYKKNLIEPSSFANQKQINKPPVKNLSPDPEPGTQKQYKHTSQPTGVPTPQSDSKIKPDRSSESQSADLLADTHRSPEPSLAEEQHSLLRNKQKNQIPEQPQKVLVDSKAEQFQDSKIGLDTREKPKQEGYLGQRHGDSNQTDELKQSRIGMKPSIQAQGSNESAINSADQQKPSIGSQIAKNILAHALSLKKNKNQSGLKIRYTAWFIVLGLMALLLWQMAIVNYTKLKSYSFLDVPLTLVCAMFSCNQQQPLIQSEFEILHAHLRRHDTKPGVITISANVINYSNRNKLLPVVRLDLIDNDQAIVASKAINLVDNPQFVDPAISKLSPGQDVKVTFEIDRPPRSAVGFELQIIN